MQPLPLVQPLLQPLVHSEGAQQLGAASQAEGAQQLGAASQHPPLPVWQQLEGAQQLGAVSQQAFDGAQQLGAASQQAPEGAQQLGAVSQQAEGAQQLGSPWPQSPALALAAPKHTINAATQFVNFIGSTPTRVQTAFKNLERATARLPS